MKKESIVLVGGGGHCKSCIEIIKSSDLFCISGIVDAHLPKGTKVLGNYVIGSDDELEMVFKKVKNAHITVGHIETSKIRKKIYHNLKRIGFNVSNLISNTSHISEFSKYEDGNSFMSYTYVNAGSKIGKCNIINNKVLIEHDCQIGDFNHISTGAIINGSVSLGNDCFIGSGSVIRNNISICDKAVIGIGSVVVKDIDKPGIYFGNPAKFIRGLDE